MSFLSNATDKGMIVPEVGTLIGPVLEGVLLRPEFVLTTIIPVGEKTTPKSALVILRGRVLAMVMISMIIPLTGSNIPTRIHDVSSLQFSMDRVGLPPPKEKTTGQTSDRQFLQSRESVLRSRESEANAIRIRRATSNRNRIDPIPLEIEGAIQAEVPARFDGGTLTFERNEPLRCLSQTDKPVTVLSAAPSLKPVCALQVIAISFGVGLHIKPAFNMDDSKTKPRAEKASGLTYSPERGKCECDFE